ncbi:MAG: CHAT domain-containing protein [Chloroflexota bacterium]|nr:CHAT domain-containing protein [Chloroflexota bacterium]
MIPDTDSESYSYLQAVLRRARLSRAQLLGLFAAAGSGEVGRPAGPPDALIGALIRTAAAHGRVGDLLRAAAALAPSAAELQMLAAAWGNRSATEGFARFNEAEMLPAPDRTTRPAEAGGASRGASAPAGAPLTSAPPATLPTVRREADILCPQRVGIATPQIEVRVALRVQTAGGAVSLPLDLRPDLPVRVRITALAFLPLGPTALEATVLPAADSPDLVFLLRPQTVGPSRITFDFSQGDHPLVTVSLLVEITTGSGADSPTTVPTTLPAPPAVTPADLRLYVHYTGMDGPGAPKSLIFTLARTGEEVEQTFAPVYLTAPPDAYMTALYARLTNLGRDARLVQLTPPADQGAAVRDIGLNLWNDLIPVELQTLFQANWAAWAGATLLLISDEPYFPWELLRPYNQSDNWEGETWCEHFRLARWLRRDPQTRVLAGPPAQITVRALACLAPVAADLPATAAECSGLRTLAAGRGVRDLSPATATEAAVRTLLAGGGFDWLHLATHGSFGPNAPDSDATVRLAVGGSLTPGAFVGPAIERFLRTARPGFFLNACHSGREGWALTGLDGWAARLVRLGAGTFIGPLWTVGDSSAAQFAAAFYRELQTRPLADALRHARHAIAAPNDPTYLAYSLYGHPNARVVFGP